MCHALVTNTKLGARGSRLNVLHLNIASPTILIVSLVGQEHEQSSVAVLLEEETTRVDLSINNGIFENNEIVVGYDGYSSLNNITKNRKSLL